MALDKASLEALMSPLRLKYVEQLNATLAEILLIASHLKEGRGSEEDIHKLKYRVHSLSGSGATYGFDAVSRTAMMLDAELSGKDILNHGRLAELLDFLIKECSGAVEAYTRDLPKA